MQNKEFEILDEHLQPNSSKKTATTNQSVTIVQAVKQLYGKNNKSCFDVEGRNIKIDGNNDLTQRKT